MFRVSLSRRHLHSFNDRHDDPFLVLVPYHEYEWYRQQGERSHETEDLMSVLEDAEIRMPIRPNLNIGRTRVCSIDSARNKRKWILWVSMTPNARGCTANAIVLNESVSGDVTYFFWWNDNSRLFERSPWYRHDGGGSGLERIIPSMVRLSQWRPLQTCHW